MSETPIICFGQQPCGFLPRRFLVAKIETARRLQRDIGGRIVFYYHDSDHDPRETQTVLVEPKTGHEQRLNFTFANKIQKKYTPLYAKRVDTSWQEEIARQLPKYLSAEHIRSFASIRADNAADFCLEMYLSLGLLDGIQVVRSSHLHVREAACVVEDYFVDVRYEEEIVRARLASGDRLRLHKGGDAYITLPQQTWQRSQISPTRDTRLRWMQSVIHCTHYVAGAGEIQYLNTGETPEIQFVQRDEIADPERAYLP
jgi:hypothetical protein